MRIRLVVALALVLALGGCGGGDREPKDKASASSAPVKKVAMDGALPRIPEGRSVPEALSDFECVRDDPSTGSGQAEGTWTATGAVANDSKAPVTFQVTVHVGPANGQGAAARTKRISAVNANGSVRFDLGEIETRSPDGPCHVQVLALR